MPVKKNNSKNSADIGLVPFNKVCISEKKLTHVITLDVLLVVHSSLPRGAMLSKETICVSVLKKAVLNSSLTSPVQGAKQRTKSITTGSDFDMFTLSRWHDWRVYI